jgi:RNA polymerase sigma-70 factor, ECF subfamily
MHARIERRCVTGFHSTLAPTAGDYENAGREEQVLAGVVFSDRAGLSTRQMRSGEMRMPQKAGAPSRLPELLPVVYEELRRIAGEHLRRERRPGHTLQTTALVHEAYVRLAGQGRERWPDRAGFCAAAAQAIRRILIDYARCRTRRKRGGTAANRVHVDPAELAAPLPAIDLLVLDDALSRLAELSPRQARVVELRYFGGLTDDETAQVLTVSRRTVQAEWRGARAWLYRELGDEMGGEPK